MTSQHIEEDEGDGSNKIQGQGEEAKKKSPKWNAQNKMEERSTDISVIKIIQIDYIKGTDNHVDLKKSIYLLLSRDALKVTRPRKVGNKGIEKAFDTSGKY